MQLLRVSLEALGLVKHYLHKFILGLSLLYGYTGSWRATPKIGAVNSEAKQHKDFNHTEREHTRKDTAKGF
jgi:hypothetical protein